MLGLLCTLSVASAAFVGHSSHPNVLAHFSHSNMRSAPKLISPSSDAAAMVEELRGLVLPRESAQRKTEVQRTRISELMHGLEEQGTGRPFLTGEDYIGNAGLLWDTYEVAYFDRSVDGRDRSGRDRSGRDRSGRDRSGHRGPSSTPIARLMGALFRLRFSLQAVGQPDVVCNYVGVRFCGLPFSVVARGRYTALDPSAVQALRDEFGTPLRDDTTVRIDFAPPLVCVGPLTFALGGSAAQPPVNLCITYVDQYIRLGLAARGGRFVFTRGGIAAEPRASGWVKLCARRPLRGRTIVAAVAAIAAALIMRDRGVTAMLTAWGVLSRALRLPAIG
jgi:hypothetical protein